ncbi:peptidoglycan recognition protein [Streptomyces sp. WMMC500]|uniref:peptidoglycan recognition protein family protein n=1 Tax=Streptomyces sp. WMMC500 TaxID=3015154 RepID=UPI00248B2A54|nr:peptidoglycan recognition protein [Streptomyces sp. WMMC500]WBB61384.1 peptidoglycan recognition protein [Streptomyces sp. WMMC500]
MSARRPRGRRWAFPLLAVLLTAAGLALPGALANPEPEPEDDRFSLVGVSWPAGGGALDGTPQVRTRDAGTGRWTAWRSLETQPRQTEPGAPAPDRAATEPVWVGDSDAAQARLLRGDGGTAPLPGRARLELVDPGDGPGVPAEPAYTTTATRPAIISRKQWGADESWRDGPPEYGSRTRAFIVHHTVDSNRYSCSQAPSIIRAIYRYHTRTNGWNDIGYNFLVDKCGRVYEGRRGGVTRPVTGAHTLGFNKNTSGAAVIGTYGSAAVPSKVTNALARLSKWRLGVAGYSRTGKATLKAGKSNGKYRKGETTTVYRLTSHRRLYPTACPGAKLYAKTGTIRTMRVG